MNAGFGGKLAGTALATVLALAAGSTSSAFAAGLQATCELSITGKSGLGPWTSRIPALKVAPTPSSAASHWNVLLVIPVKSLEDGNKVRDTQMHDMFESKQWPEIRAEIRDANPDEAAKSLHLPVALTIRDQKRNVDATLSNWKTAAGHAEFDADVSVSLEGFGLEAPSVLGLSRVDDEVKIHAHVTVDGLPPAK